MVRVFGLPILFSAFLSLALGQWAQASFGMISDKGGPEKGVLYVERSLEDGDSRIRFYFCESLAGCPLCYALGNSEGYFEEELSELEELNLIPFWQAKVIDVSLIGLTLASFVTIHSVTAGLGPALLTSVFSGAGAGFVGHQITSHVLDPKFDSLFQESAVYLFNSEFSHGFALELDFRSRGLKSTAQLLHNQLWKYSYCEESAFLGVVTTRFYCHPPALSERAVDFLTLEASEFYLGY